LGAGIFVNEDRVVGSEGFGDSILGNLEWHGVSDPVEIVLAWFSCLHSVGAISTGVSSFRRVENELIQSAFLIRSLHQGLRP
jgi:hypothetical protein